jgi:hypothetical protein
MTDHPEKLKRKEDGQLSSRQSIERKLEKRTVRLLEETFRFSKRRLAEESA